MGDELICKRLIHCRCRFDDDLVVELMQNDDRYKNMIDGEQAHKIENIFDDKIDALKNKLVADKKIFRQFIKCNSLSIGEEDKMCDILQRFEALMSDKDEIKKVDAKHIELLLMEYVSKRQEKEKKERLKNEEAKAKKNEIAKNENKSNGNHGSTKKRQRSEIVENEENKKNCNEPKRKRQKTLTLHDPNEYKKEDEMDEGEIEELEEGECSDIDNKKVMNENGNAHKNESEQRKEHKNGKHRRLSSDYSNSSRSRSRSSSNSNENDRRHKHRKSGKRRNGKKDDYHYKKRGKRSSTKKRKDRSEHHIDNVLYGIGSDLDENDLYYRGDIKRNVDDQDIAMNDNDDEDLREVNVHNGRGRRIMRGHWRGHRQQQQQHHDLDYVNNYNHDQEINADSYNLDNDDMARWAH